MTHREFRTATGRWPRQDDLQRANCERVGQPGHLGCGVCACGTPRWECPTHLRDFLDARITDVADARPPTMNHPSGDDRANGSSSKGSNS